jgi:MFS superfamily sulfate permease-like transporter
MTHSISLIPNKQTWRKDLVAGFLVFLIALPLCLGIALASGFPPMAGIISAVIGGLMVSRINGSYLTISGPAAGLIVVILTSVQNLGQGDMMAGYRFTLAAIVIAGLLQVMLGFFKAGRVAVFFPASVVHGMLAAIGIIIMIKQIPVMLGVHIVDNGSMLAAIGNLPKALSYFVPKIGLIALFGMVILIGWPHVQQRFLKQIPAPLLVIVSGMILGLGFDLPHFQAEEFFKLPQTIGLEGPFLIAIPDSVAASFYFPDFSMVTTVVFWESVVTIALVGSIETLLVATAVDKLDPQKRYSDLNRDLTAIGIGNTLAGFVGGLPMIAEVIRSSANIDNGAQTGWANFFHGVFLLLFVALFPWIIDSIPLASLAALLVYTGFRLTSPTVFAKTLDLGKEQLMLFVITIIGVLSTNLLMGVVIGIAIKLLFHVGRGVPLTNLLSMSYRLEQQQADKWVIKISGAAIFSNLIGLKSELTKIADGKTVIVDVFDAKLIDHTVMEFIDRYREDYCNRGGYCEIHGLSEQEAYSDHKLSARVRK